MKLPLRKCAHVLVWFYLNLELIPPENCRPEEIYVYKFRTFILMFNHFQYMKKKNNHCLQNDYPTSGNRTQKLNDVFICAHIYR